ncbi:LysM peptidoglycan-binding domain-containing protein [Acidiferrimicrobium sp. IK]|uniref:BTAD domain-containing putative transcriptional regulator n=1 Tax=Acidiferrimicrobium sp. IK TaxID=2871700 RepID=UPI0021CB8484|nr:BTAD domain-containing putative transcriptional regulator [Acidiferrimicrobium sp. IK]MCU4185164.1 LysM peptidoglycan-binding domain-containing protein [Acidiferrimicrobium sp. IK]
MGRLAAAAKGLAALVLLAALVAGVPLVLWHFVGWPLPHHIPSLSTIGHAVTRHGIPARTLVEALAVVVWITWAVLVASVAAEIPAALGGRRAPRLPIAGVFQPVTGRLVAAVVVACLALAPRPAHTGTLGRGMAAISLRPPVATLVANDGTITDTDLAAATRPVAPAPAPPIPARATTTDAPPGADASAMAPVPTAAPATYIVQRGDTLWGIAERELGDPLRWSEIFQLNEDRPQPGGVTLTDPHWIDPGWTLLLPAPAAAGSASTPAPPTSQSHQSPATVRPATVPPSTSPPATTPPTTSPSTGAPPTTTPSELSPTTAPHRVDAEPVDRSGEPVRLPSGSVVAGSFAAAVAATVAIGRLRRRHAYRYRPPEPGRTLATEPARPTIHHLRQAAAATAPLDGSGPVPVMPVGEEERIGDPGHLDVASRGNEVVTIELTDLSGVALVGPGVDDVARALLAALLVRAEPGAAEVLLTDDLAERLLPGLDPNRAIRRLVTTDQAARAVESERVARSRRFEAAGAADATQFRAENPENPLPLLLVLLDTLPAESLGRWAALVADAPRLAICVVSLAPSPIAAGQLRMDAARRVLDATPVDRLGALLGTQLFGLRADEATEVIAAVAEVAGEGDLDEEPFATNATVIPLRADGPSTDDLSTDDPGEPWPEPSPSLSANGSGDRQAERPIAVRMFGHFEVAVHGEAVVTGLRSRARDVFAWCLLRPEGATSDEAVDALWPDTAPGRVHGQFWRSFSDLRARLREAGGGDLEVLTKAGEHYRPCSTEIACDLWEFQAALGEAARADDDEVARAALRRAVEVYRGDLLAGMDRPWVEPVRQDLHRRSLDAHLRLAELEEQTGRPDAAVEVLEQAITRDRYAEEPYRRLMVLHAAHGRPSAVTDVWRLLQGRLAELDLDVESATAGLYHQLTADQQPRPGPDRVRSPR